MRQARTAVEQRMYAAQCEVGTVTQVDTLKHTWCHRSAVAHLLRFRQCHDATVCDITAFNQAYPLQFRQCRELCHGIVCEIGTACQINVANSVAQLDKLNNTCISDPRAVSQVNVVQVLPKPCYGQYGAVCNVATLVEDEIAEAGRSLHNLLYASILQFGAVRQVKDAESLIIGILWKA